MYHAKTIALFISHIYRDYEKSVCQGVVDQATEYGFQTEVYTTLDGEDLGPYSVGEASILRIPNLDDFSGIIIASCTYLNTDLKNQIIAMVKKKSTSPVIEIGDWETHFPSISLENNLTAGTLTEHLITIHDYKRICYLGCSSEAFFSDQRERAYRNTMERHALTVGDHDVCLCGYSECEVATALKFFSENGNDLPDAVVCYNDHMALLLMVVATRQGYQIPKDFALVGCDATPEGQSIVPPLTTVSFPTYQIGTEAVEQLLKQMRGETIPNRICVFAEPVMGGSCGCSYHMTVNPILFRQKLMDQIDDTKASILTSMRMSAAFSHVTDIDEGMELLSQYISRIHNCTEFYVCLNSNWDELSGHIMKLTDAPKEDVPDTDTLYLKLAVKHGKRLPECTFPKKTLLPEYINRDSSNVHFVSPLFFEEREFGYVVLAFADNKVDYPFHLVQWIMNLSQLLQNLCEIKSANLMQHTLESIYMKDSLTGLLNRHGYEQQLPKLLAETRHGQLLTSFLFDMDCLKVINDEFGHTEGDFALQAIGQAISVTASDQPEMTICTRFGGDEFYVLSNAFSESTASEFAQQVEQHLNNYNELSTKPYNLSISVGFSQLPYDQTVHTEEIEALMKEADANMYQKKKGKKKNVLRSAT